MKRASKVIRLIAPTQLLFTAHIFPCCKLGVRLVIELEFEPPVCCFNFTLIRSEDRIHRNILGHSFPLHFVLFLHCPRVIHRGYAQF